MGFTQCEQQADNSLKKVTRISETCEDIRSNIHVIGVLGEKKEDEAEKLFKEIMAENFPNLAKDINQPTQEAE